MEVAGSTLFPTGTGKPLSVEASVLEQGPGNPRFKFPLYQDAPVGGLDHVFALTCLMALL